ncbi:MAG: hypothetical protein OXB88_11125 [Bacteriovoracales bacterium]|nr:hypothetical protein [Bacteriovoracales bacterium]
MKIRNSRVQYSFLFFSMMVMMVFDVFAKSKSDFNQYIPLEAPQVMYENGGDEEKMSYFLGNTVKEGDEIDLNEKQKLNLTGNTLIGEFSLSESYKKSKNRTILDNVVDKSSHRRTFFIIRDTFDYKSRSNNFSRIYRSPTKKNISIGFHIVDDRYYPKGWLRLFWGQGIGVGHNRGRGVFLGATDLNDSNSYMDRAQFSLYTIPLDLRLGIEISLGPHLAFEMLGGPSLLGIIERRSDRTDEDEDKYKRQFGVGYFGSANIKLMVSSFADKIGFKIYSQNWANRFSVNFKMRTHSYSGFKDEDLSIEGTSFGLGVTYDFL